MFNETYIKSYKIRLEPTKAQEEYLYQMANAARFAYNWTLTNQEENYKNGGKFITSFNMTKRMTCLKKTEGYEWLRTVSANGLEIAVKDGCEAYEKWFDRLRKGQVERGKGKPKFKKKETTHLAFACKYNRFYAGVKFVQVEKCGKVKTTTQGAIAEKYINPRISHNGKHWFVSYGVEEEVKQQTLNDAVLGVNMGIRRLAVCSNGNTYENVNQKVIVKKLEKRLRRLQNQLERKYKMNSVKTQNMIKLERQIKLVRLRLNEIRQNHLHQSTAQIIKTMPRRVVIQDLNLTSMMKNKHLSAKLRKQKLYEFRRQLEYKCKKNGIEFKVVNKSYRSAELCSSCGGLKKNLSVEDRVYKCDVCHQVLEKALNTSINLSKVSEVEYMK